MPFNKLIIYHFWIMTLFYTQCCYCYWFSNCKRLGRHCFSEHLFLLLFAYTMSSRKWVYSLLAKCLWVLYYLLMKVLSYIICESHCYWSYSFSCTRSQFLFLNSNAINKVLRSRFQYLPSFVVHAISQMTCISFSFCCLQISCNICTNAKFAFAFFLFLYVFVFVAIWLQLVVVIIVGLAMLCQLVLSPALTLASTSTSTLFAWFIVFYGLVWLFGFFCLCFWGSYYEYPVLN